MSPADELDEMLSTLTSQVASIRLLTNRPKYSDDSDPKNQDFVIPRVNKMLNIAEGWIMKLQHDLEQQQQRERELAEQYGWGGWGTSSLTPAADSRGEFDPLLKGLERVKIGVFFSLEGDAGVGREMVSRGVQAFEGWV
ncbi:hypothetical protein QBC40DRAFT_297695 [Triangularia verruculosa]|uniref:Uncharacterized protein n=1 Tax=Triangularia verruculosa TaxID=2587418 RepID=A0AAN6XEK6_9PEZI|nr:hypothetical protein QBC40DRAFT_297695 [Triangularia verruculosa]